MEDGFAQDVVDAFKKFRVAPGYSPNRPDYHQMLMDAIDRMEAQIAKGVFPLKGNETYSPDTKKYLTNDEFFGLNYGKPKLIIEFRDKTYTVNVKMNHFKKANIVEKHRSTAALLMQSSVSRLRDKNRHGLKIAPSIRIVMERRGKHCDDDNLPTAGKYFRDGIADVLGAHRGVKPNKNGHYDDSLPCYQWEYTQCPKIKGSLTTYRVMVYWE